MTGTTLRLDFHAIYSSTDYLVTIRKGIALPR